MRLFDRFLADGLRGVRYAANVFVATTVLWIVVKIYGDANPIWAISAMVATSDPQVGQSMASFRGRLVNTLVGCVIGLLFVAIGRTDWALPTALATAVLVSSYFVRVPTMWRQAPITAAIIIAGSLHHHDKAQAIGSAMDRIGEVLFGCVVGIGSAWVLSRLWPSAQRTPC